MLSFEKDIDELLYQLSNDELPGRFWALHELAQKFPSNPRTLAELRTIIGGNSHWSLRAEATYLLQNFHSDETQAILLDQIKSTDYHLRKAAVLALGSRFTDAARETLHHIADSDPNDDVTATALVALSKIDTQLSLGYLQQFLNKKSWYDVKRIAALKVMENYGKADFASLIKENASMKYNYGVRQQALNSWGACAPSDPQFIDALLKVAKNDILPVRSTAITLLGKLKIEQALPVLEEIRAKNGDSDIRKAAKDAIEEIQRMQR